MRRYLLALGLVPIMLLAYDLGGSSPTVQPALAAPRPTVTVTTTRTVTATVTITQTVTQTITAAPVTVTQTVTQTVTAPAPTTTPPTTTTPTTTTTVAAGCLLSGSDPDGVTIPAGMTCEVDGTYEPAANVIVRGTLVMRAGDIMRFTGINESNYVGGGMDPIASDVGLWVMGDGVLDVQGTPKAGWNRTGDDPTWTDSDELVSAPIVGTTNFAPFVRGSAVPQASPLVPPTEIMNLTRDVVIAGTPTGRSHIFIRSTQPQTIKYATLRYLGPTGVLGRYPLHFHMAGEGSRGSIVEGTVLRDVGNHAYVAHMSNGVTFEDTIAYNVTRDAYWWDPGTATDDTLYLHAIAAKVSAYVPAGGEDRFRVTGFRLSQGSGNTCAECVAVGVQGESQASGFHWPEDDEGVWTFTDNLAHNNSHNGIFTWQNTSLLHVIDGFIAYRNADYGIDHGAYRNRYIYRNLVLVGNADAGVLTNAHSDGVGRMRWENVLIADSPVGFLEGEITLPSFPPTIICGATYSNVPTHVDDTQDPSQTFAAC
jgi:hypothetical protein